MSQPKIYSSNAGSEQKEHVDIVNNNKNTYLTKVWGSVYTMTARSLAAITSTILDYPLKFDKYIASLK